MAIQFPEWWGFLSTVRIFLCHILAYASYMHTCRIHAGMLSYIHVYVALFPLAKEQLFGGSFLDLLLAYIAFSNFTMKSHGLPVDLADWENKRIWDFVSHKPKYTIFPNCMQKNHWWGNSLKKYKRGSLAISFVYMEKTTELRDLSASSFIYH